MAIDRTLEADPLREKAEHELRSEEISEIEIASIVALNRARATDAVALIVVLASVGAFVLTALVRYYAPAGISENDERSIYAGTILLGTPLALAAGWGYMRARALLFRPSIVFPLAMALGNAFFWAVALFLLHHSLGLSRPERLRRALDEVLALFVATNAVAIAACLAGQSARLSMVQRQGLKRIVDDGYFLVPLLGAAAMGMFSNYALARWPMAMVLGAAALPALARGGSRPSIGARSGWAADAAVILLIVGVVFDPQYPITPYHYGYWVGPAASFVAGHRPLVDVNCQYGVGPVYFLGWLFRLGLVPPSYQGMSALLGVLGIVHFVVEYALLRLTLRSRAYALLALFVMLTVRIVSGPRDYVWAPSLGAMRFMWGDALLLSVALRERFPRWAKPFRALGVAIVALSSVWSVETFAATLATFLGVFVYEELFRDRRRPWLLDALEPLGAALAGIALAHAALAVEIRIATGQWPHWSHYFAYIEHYSKWSVWAMSITPWDPWAPFALIYFASLTALLARRFVLGRRTLGTEHKIVWGMTVLGIVQFSHYVGRSHIEHLRIYMAEIFVAAYWLDRVARPSAPVGNAFRKSFLGCTYAAVTLVVFSAVPGFAGRFDHMLIGNVASDRPFLSPWSVDPDAPWRGGSSAHLRKEAIALIEKYQPEKHDVALFIEQYIRPLVFLELRRGHVWPLGLSEEDGMVPSVRKRILETADGLKVGDIIFVGDTLDPLDQEIVAGLANRFGFTELETSPSRIKVIRLDPAPAPRT
jgi:hypothetical protein